MTGAPVAGGGVGAARLIGQRLPRKEDPRLLTGSGQFVDDITVPGLLHVAFVRSPIARGRIVSIDTSAAREIDGVRAIYTAEDLARRPVQMLSFFLNPVEVPVPLLAEDRVAYVGDPVALVVADSRELAEDGAALVTVEYAPEPAVVTIADAMRGAPVHPGTEDNVAAAMGTDEPDAALEATLANAPHLVTQHVVHQRISQSPMETRGVVASRSGADELTLWITCASPHLVARYVAQALGLPQTCVRVIAKDVGGSFGLKNHPWREEMAVIVATLLFGHPLKWIEDRLESLTACNQAREQEMTLRTAFDAEGRLLTSHGDYSLNNGAYPQGADANVAVHIFIWSAYKMPAYTFHSRGWYSNTPGLAAYRGPWALESLARETALDKAARRIGIDPVEIRRRNLLTLSDQPTTTQFGIPLDDITPAECLDKLVAYLDVAAFRAEQAAARRDGRYLGLGLATYIEPTGGAGSFAVLTGELAQVRIDPDGRVTAVMSTHSQGHGTTTTMAQCIADRLGVPYDDVTVHEGDSARGGFGPGAAGSRQGVIGGGAAIRAAELLADKVRRLAGHLLNADPDSVSIVDGMVHVAGAEEMSRSLKSIAEIAYGEPARLPEGFEAGLEAQYRYTPPPLTFTSAAHACIVEVSAETGFVEIQRWISSEDCGNVINPAVVEGQIAGGIAQGIGMVLLEKVSFDAAGNPTAATYKDYLLPAISNVPTIEFVHAGTPARNVGGFRGVGEGGAIIGPPTLVNAIADALAPFGELTVDLPLTPSKLLDLIEGRDIVHREAASAPPPPVPPEPAREIAIGMHGEGLPPASETMLPGGAKAPATAAIDGSWNMTLFAPTSPQEMVGHFQTEGDVLTGTIESPEGAQAFTGTISGNAVAFDLKVTKPMKITLKYSISIDGDRLTGKVKMGMFGTAKLTGVRA